MSASQSIQIEQGEGRALPRFLLGGAALFWGAMIGQPLAGLVLALLLEASHWTPLRWEFSDRTYVRAWQLSILLMGLAVMLWWFGARSAAEVYGALVWMPAYFLPLQLAQEFGMRPAIPLSTFSYFARRKYEEDLRAGRPVKLKMVNFGRIYLLVMLLCAALGAQAATPFFFPILLVFLMWSIRSGSRFAQGPLRAWGIALLLIACLGFVGQLSLREMYKYLSSGRWGGDEEEYQETRRTRTRIGQLGEVKQSNKIFWRLYKEQGEFPSLLRTASYNVFTRNAWKHREPVEADNTEGDYDAIRELGPYRLMRDEPGANPNPPKQPRFGLRGRVGFHSLVPLPGDTRSMQDVMARELERNSLGTVRIQPEHAVLNTSVIWQDDKSVEKKPYTPSWRKYDVADLTEAWMLNDRVPRVVGELGVGSSPLDVMIGSIIAYESIDLRVPEEEQETVRAIVDELHLRGKPVDTQVAILRAWFTRNFSYTRYLDIEQGKKKKTAMSQFLTEVRNGHCEYFATAATLLLREAGTPARYAVGFSVKEMNGSEAVLRGTHMHAWCRAWDTSKQRWRDVDLTPPSWVSQDAMTLDWQQKWLDKWQKLREDMVVWRTSPENIGRMTAVVVVLVLLLVAVPAWRLLRSGRRIAREGNKRTKPRRDLSPLLQLEKLAERFLGRRGEGQPMVAWLEQGVALWPEQDRPLWREAFALHQRVRFDPAGPLESEQIRLKELVGELRLRLKRGQ